jgi:hypothetical protein
MIYRDPKIRDKRCPKCGGESLIEARVKSIVIGEKCSAEFCHYLEIYYK